MLWHVSEDAAIERFEPHRSATALTDKLLVWAVDTRHLPLFWFPRDCPRATFWAGPRTAEEDVERFLDGERSQRVHAVESAWLERVRAARLVAYRMPEDPFVAHTEVAGYWLSREPVVPLDRAELRDVLALHAAARIELRVRPALWPLWDRVTASSLEYSGIRLRNARPRAG
ncbi:hypothetical protein BH18CHL2_BH18CHL2_07590 [soil metagenome]